MAIAARSLAKPPKPHQGLRPHYFGERPPSRFAFFGDCFFANRPRIRPGDQQAQQAIVSIIVANVGLDPAKDINWVDHGPRNPKELLDKVRSTRS
jgi:hypothetical protein